MSYHTCGIPGCNHAAPHALGLRLRVKDAGAVWAPVTNWYLCDRHAVGGADIEVNFIPRRTRKIAMDVGTPPKSGNDSRRVRRTVQIEDSPRAVRILKQLGWR